jgi:hypothetical protein
MVDSPITFPAGFLLFYFQLISKPLFEKNQQKSVFTP